MNWTAYYSSLYNKYKLNYHEELIKEAWEIPEMKFTIEENTISNNCGWYVHDRKNKNGGYLHKDLKFHRSTGHEDHYGYGEAPGYYRTRIEAENYLSVFMEKHNMNDLIVIQVEINGKKVPLHQISEQTLLSIRESSKPKEVPVARVAESNGQKYLLLKAPKHIGNYAGKIVVIELKNGYVNGFWPLEREQQIGYQSDRVFSYKNVQTIE